MNNGIEKFLEEFGDRDVNDIQNIIYKLPFLRDSHGRRKYSDREIRDIKEMLKPEELPEQVSASMMYEFDTTFSKNPTAICLNKDLGLPSNCVHCEGKFCHFKFKCDKKLDLETGKMLYKDSFMKKANKMVIECIEHNEEALAEYERSMNTLDYDTIFKRLLGKE